jgi:hypothetical protein
VLNQRKFTTQVAKTCTGWKIKDTIMEDGMQDKEEDLDRDPYIYGQCVF